MRRKSLIALGVPLLGALALVGCEHNDSERRVTYEVTVTNLSEGQPLSPPALILHHDGYHAWQVGSAATDGLEILAEGGDGSTLLSEAESNAEVVATESDTAVILPGESRGLSISGHMSSDLAVSLATMLVNTNDAFTGLESEPVGGLSIFESRSIDVAAYDAGTESNSESAATVPGPAAGGEGYNAARDDRDSVGGHPGVISGDDGLTGSALDASHRFDNPVARITIKRLM